MKRKLNDAITSIDAFGAPISLTFKGKKSFQTTRGGILTVIIYFLMFLQIWSQVNQLYTQVDPITSAYETSYLPKEVVYLPDLKQQVTLGFRDNKNKAWVKELDPRAVKFIPNFPKTTESFSQSAAFDWCDSTVNDHLNIVN